MAVEVTIEPATLEDAAELAEHMRAADAAEVEAGSGGALADITRESVQVSEEAWAVRFDGALACIWGVSRLNREAGAVWLLGTPLMDQRPRVVWCLSRAILPQLLDRWPILVNAIDVRHVQAIRWAERLGFLLADPEPFGVAGLPFRKFCVTKEDLRV